MMSAADGGTGATTRRRRRRSRRGNATLVCILLIAGLGLAVTRAHSVSATAPAPAQQPAANPAWPAFAQTASDAANWMVALRAFATAETNSSAATEPAWPAFAQTASDAGTWLVALRAFATEETQVEQAAQAAQAARAAAAARPATHSVTVQRAPAPPPAPWDGVVPPPGQATAWGCDAALAYLHAYAAPGFTLECPGYADGHQGMTCFDEPGSCPNAAVIAIATPCPQSYMNEASNSWVLIGRSNAPIDPYGGCR
jgi:hypothetical protein